MVEGNTDVALMSGNDATEVWVGDHGLEKDTAAKVGKFADVSALAKGYVDLEALQGRSITMPKDDASDEDKTKRMGEIYGKLGRPDAADGYKMEKPADLPEGLGWSDDAAKGIREVAHKLGLNQAQLDGLVAFQLEHQTKTHQANDVAIKEAQEKQAADGIVALKTKWGESKYDANLAGAEKAYQKYGGDELVDLFDKMGLKNHPVVANAFYEIYKEKMAEDNLAGGEGRTPQGDEGILSYPNSPDLKGT